MQLKLFDLIEEFQYVRDSVLEIGSKLVANRTTTHTMLPKILKNPVLFAAGTSHEIYSVTDGSVCDCLSYISDSGMLYLCFIIDQQTLIDAFDMDIYDIQQKYPPLIQCVRNGVDCYACVAAVITPQKTYTVTDAAAVLACLTNEYASGF